MACYKIEILRGQMRKQFGHGEIGRWRQCFQLPTYSILHRCVKDWSLTPLSQILDLCDKGPNPRTVSLEFRSYVRFRKVELSRGCQLPLYLPFQLYDLSPQPSRLLL